MGSKKSSIGRISGLEVIIWVLLIIFVMLFAVIVMRAIDRQQVSSEHSSVQPAPTAEAAKPAAPKTWQKVAELSGSANRRGDVFHLQGGKQRLTYTVSGQYSPFVNIYIGPSSKDLDRDGGLPEISMATKSSDTFLYKGAGDFYLEVNGQGEWTAVVEELR